MAFSENRKRERKRERRTRTLSRSAWLDTRTGARSFGGWFRRMRSCGTGEPSAIDDDWEDELAQQRYPVRARGGRGARQGRAIIIGVGPMDQQKHVSPTTQTRFPNYFTNSPFLKKILSTLSFFYIYWNIRETSTTYPLVQS